MSILGSVYAKAGRRREALGTIDRMLHHAKGRVQGAWVARVYAMLGRKEEALAALERSVRDHAEDVILLVGDKAVASLRDDPRFHALLRQMNLKG